MMNGRTSLQAKRKFSFVEGKIPKPTTPEKLEDWIAVHSMLVAWLLNTVEPSLRSTLPYYDDAQALWTHLKQRFCVVNGTRICQLKASLGECKQGKDEEVSAYFGRLSRIWDELTTYVKTPTCKCNACICSIATQVAKLRAEDYLHHFLLGLDGAYASIRSHLLAQDPLPSVDHAYQRVIQDESLRRGGASAINSFSDNIMAFKVHSDSRGKQKSAEFSDKFCTHCHKEGHDETTCFHIHGFPEWWADRPRGGRGSGRGGSMGGRSNRGTGRGKGPSTSTSVRANNIVATSNDTQGTKITLPASSEGSGLASITPSQWQQILDLINIPKSKDCLHGKINNNTWIIDTGASNHVIGNL
ncbi:hypothetical protein RND81_09G098600 [Saponaria officinalis]|uniref:Retrotransposon gag domain-containing protein n=1 Tax=Saponaria officinalis TaxID=3572 RepID=A0AAW1IJU1_SAPOF